MERMGKRAGSRMPYDLYASEEGLGGEGRDVGRDSIKNAVTVRGGFEISEMVGGAAAAAAATERD